MACSETNTFRLLWTTECLLSMLLVTTATYCRPKHLTPLLIFLWQKDQKKKKILIFLFGLLNKTVCCCCWLTIPTLSLLDQLNSYYALWIGSGALTRPNRKPPAKWKSYNSCADLQRGRCGQESVECLLRVKVTALTGCNMRLFRCSTGLHIQLSQTTS